MACLSRILRSVSCSTGWKNWTAIIENWSRECNNIERETKMRINWFITFTLECYQYHREVFVLAEKWFKWLRTLNQNCVLRRRAFALVSAVFSSCLSSADFSLHSFFRLLFSLPLLFPSVLISSKKGAMKEKAQKVEWNGWKRSEIEKKEKSSTLWVLRRSNFLNSHSSSSWKM